MWLGVLSQAQQALGTTTLAAWASNPFYRRVDYTTGPVYLYRDKYVVPAAPPALRQQLLLLAHDHGGHWGVDKTMLHLKRMCVVWTGMRDDVQRHVRTCPSCQREAAPPAQGRTGPLQVMEPPTRPFAVLELDLLDLPEADSGHKYIIGIQDVFTKWVFLLPTKVNSGAEVVAALHENVTRVYGPPAWVISDGGSTIENKTTGVYFTKYNIGHHVSRAGHSEGHGGIERVNRTVAQFLRKHLAGAYRTWPTIIKDVALALNQTVHDTIGMAPITALTGTEAPLLAGAEIAGAATSFAAADVTHMAAIIDALHHQVYDNILAAGVRNKVYYDKVAQTRVFEVGSHVLIHDISRPHKLQSYYTDTGTVVAKVNETTYTVMRRLSGRTEDMHTNRLVAYNAARTTDTSELRRRLQPGEQIVERIVRHIADTDDDGKTAFKFLVHWTGLPDVFDSWHPAAHLLHLDVFKAYCVEHSLDELVPRKPGRHRPRRAH